MRRSLLDLLACPRDHSWPLLLESTDAGASEEVIDGRLACSECGAVFPLVQGIPSFVAPEPGEESIEDNERRLRDEQAATYDRQFLPQRNYIELRATTARLEPRPTDLILEVGAGTGRMTMSYAGRCRDAVALDFSLASLLVLAQRVRTLGKPVPHLVHGDLKKLPFRDGVFSTHFACMVYQHIPGERNRDTGIAEAVRVTIPGGRIVLNLYNYNWHRQRSDTRSGTQAEREGFHSGGRVYFHRFQPPEVREWLGRRLQDIKMIGYRMPRAEELGRLGLALEYGLQRTRLGLALGHYLLVSGTSRQSGVAPTVLNGKHAALGTSSARAGK